MKINGASFRESDLTESKFGGPGINPSRIISANFTGATLNEASFEDAELGGKKINSVTFSGPLSGVSFENTTFHKVKCLNCSATELNLSGAKNPPRALQASNPEAIIGGEFQIAEPDTDSASLSSIEINEVTPLDPINSMGLGYNNEHIF